MLADSIGRMLDNTYSFEHRREVIAGGVAGDAAVWGALGELGAPYAFVAESVGGFGGTMLDCGIVMRELGRVLCIEPVGALWLAPLRLLAALGQEDRLTEILEAGACLSVLDGTGLEIDGDRISGTVRTVEGAPGATGFLVLGPDGQLRRCSTDSDGVSVKAFRLVDGRIAGDVTLDGAKPEIIASDCVSAFAQVRREVVVAEQWFQLGSMLSATEATIDYVQQRRQFGRHLGQFQTVQAAIAEMAVACEEAKACTLLAANALDAATSSDEAGRAKAGAQLRMIRLAEIVATNAVQLHGGMGVSEELPIAAHYRQMIAFRSRFGTAREARKVMARVAVATDRFAQSAILGEAA